MEGKNDWRDLNVPHAVLPLVESSTDASLTLVSEFEFCFIVGACPGHWRQVGVSHDISSPRNGARSRFTFWLPRFCRTRLLPEQAWPAQTRKRALGPLLPCLGQGLELLLVQIDCHMYDAHAANLFSCTNLYLDRLRFLSIFSIVALTSLELLRLLFKTLANRDETILLSFFLFCLSKDNNLMKTLTALQVCFLCCKRRHWNMGLHDEKEKLKASQQSPNLQGMTSYVV